MRKISILGLVALMLTFTSCVEKSTNKKSTSSTQTDTITTPSTDPGNSDDTDPVYEDPSLPNYYTLPVIAVHGTSNPNPDPLPDGIFWSSDRNVSVNDQYIFQTDSKMNIRVKALSAPTQNSTDSNGKVCRNYALNYTKLHIDLCVRAKNGSCVYEHSFSDLAINSYSPVKEFSVPANTSEPLVIEVRDVKWNYTYLAYGYGQSSFSDYPEFDAVYYPDCVRFQIEFATDETKDIPGARY